MGRFFVAAGSDPPGSAAKVRNENCALRAAGIIPEMARKVRRERGPLRKTEFFIAPVIVRIVPKEQSEFEPTKEKIRFGSGINDADVCCGPLWPLLCRAPCVYVLANERRCVFFLLRRQLF